MGGASTEIGGGTTEVVLEAAHFDPARISRAVRRHKLPSEAAKRFERGVDPQIAGGRAAALRRAAGRARRGRGRWPAAPSSATARPRSQIAPAACTGRRSWPACRSSRRRSRHRLEQVGCTVADGPDACSQVRPPSWRPDLTDPADLVEEVVRLEGYDQVPSVLPTAPAGSRADGRRSSCAGRCPGRWPRPASSRCSTTRSSARPCTTPSAWPPTTRAGGRCGWPTRSRTPSRSCAPRCCPAC